MGKNWSGSQMELFLLFMTMMRKLHTLICFLCAFTVIHAQPQPPTQLTMPKIPPMRVLHHDNIDNNQKLILKLDGTDDSLFTPTKNPEKNKQITEVLMATVNNMQVKVESNPAFNDNDKFKWLRAINDMLASFASAYRIKLIKGEYLGDLITAYDEAMELEWKKESIKPIIENNVLEVGNILVENYGLKNNKGVNAGKEILLLKTCYKYPRQTMAIITTNPNAYFVDSIIRSIAYKDPEQLYNYAAAPNALGRKIQTVNDPLVKTIGLLALMKTGRQYFPFLDNIYHNKISIDSITKVMNDSTAYYKLLVRTQIEYVDRMQHNDTPLVMNVLTSKLKSKVIENYVTEINGLHEEKSDKVRFASLNSLSSEDLYYVAVLGEEEIYTSSFVSGVYPRIFQRMKVQSSDTLLSSVKYDYYRRFIKMTANYNTLDDFLKHMEKPKAEKLMKDFVTGLEKTRTLEAAVDVADSYGSIYNPKTKQIVLDQINENLMQSERDNNKRGQTIYNLLNIIFLSMDSSAKIDLPARLGIDGVYNMPHNKLEDSSGRVIVQQFFYGDKDGQGVFKSFFQHYPSNTWKKVDKPEWVELSSTKGRPITIYMNKPLENEQSLDAKAQEALGRYLELNGIEPTVVIHRGHSYFADETIDQLPTSAKVVLMGSCGGYQNLSTILDYCPTAHIIASKQTGTGSVNIKLITSITENLRLGKSLDWPVMWKEMEKGFKGETKDRFDDYVPPYKNLGAIFIMAYKKQMEESAQN
jgi:hypothetical protein